MTDYVKTVDFAAKDALASGNPSKIVAGTELDTEFDNIAVAVATKANSSSPTLTTPNIGTPSAGTLTNCTGLPVSTGISGLGTGVAAFLATPSSANLASAVTGETGSGALVFATSPALVTPNLGTPSAGVLTNCTGTASGLTAGNATNATFATISANKGYLSGCTMSTAGTSSTMSIAAGVASDSTSAYLMTLSAIAKTTSSWAVGTATGGLDTGSIGANTWYYFYVIRRTDTGVVDVVFSTSSTSPTLPASYTQYRYIGAGRTDGSSNWTKFLQFGREFYIDNPPIEVDTSTTTNATTIGLTYVPQGRRVSAIINIAAQANLYVSPLDLTDQAPSATASPLGQAGNVLTQTRVLTNTSAQFRYRHSVNGTLRIATAGWVDYADIYG